MFNFPNRQIFQTHSGRSPIFYNTGKNRGGVGPSYKKNSFLRRECDMCDVGCDVTGRSSLVQLLPSVDNSVPHALPPAAPTVCSVRQPMQLHLTRYNLAEGNGMEEVVGSIPTRSTNLL